MKNLRFDGFPPTSWNHGQPARSDAGLWQEGVLKWVSDDLALFLMATHCFTDCTPNEGDGEPTPTTGDQTPQE